jgi:hypothetical protein
VQDVLKQGAVLDGKPNAHAEAGDGDDIIETRRGNY